MMIEIAFSGNSRSMYIPYSFSFLTVGRLVNHYCNIKLEQTLEVPSVGKLLELPSPIVSVSVDCVEVTPISLSLSSAILLPSSTTVQ